MKGIPEKDAWLLDSPAYKVLSIGDNPIEFAIELKKLWEENQTRFETLFGICDRLEFIEQVRHASRLWRNRNREQKALYQLDRLITYLTTTCIDVATGERFQTYKSWLKRAYESNSLNANIWNSAILELSKAESESIAELFVKWSIEIYENDFEPNQSIRRAFKDFICGMDNWFKEWLFNEYIIQFIDSEDNFREPRWETLNTEDKGKRIAYYLYDLRNRYTHTVGFYEPLDLQQRNFGTFGTREGRYLSTIFRQSNGPDRAIFLRSGLFESDIIRLFVVVWLRKNWLSIQDNAPIIQRYWDRILYRRLGFNFLAELEENHRLIENWCSYHLSPLFNELSLDVFQLQTLHNSFAKQFIDKHQKISHGPISLCNTDSYLALIEEINSKITAYNAQHANLKWNMRVNEVRKLFSEITGLPETQHLYNCIEDFKRDLFRNLDVPLY